MVGVLNLAISIDYCNTLSFQPIRSNTCTIKWSGKVYCNFVAPSGPTSTYCIVPFLDPGEAPLVALQQSKLIISHYVDHY